MRQQRAMDHQPVIAIDLPGIGFVIVNPVPVESQRRVVEQQCRVESDRLGMGFIGGGLWRDRAGGVVGAIDQFLPFCQGQRAALFDVVPDRDEPQWAGPALFAGHVLYRAGAFGLDACE